MTTILLHPAARSWAALLLFSTLTAGCTGTLIEADLGNVSADGGPLDGGTDANTANDDTSATDGSIVDADSNSDVADGSSADAVDDDTSTADATDTVGPDAKQDDAELGDAGLGDAELGDAGSGDTILGDTDSDDAYDDGDGAQDTGSNDGAANIDSTTNIDTTSGDTTNGDTTSGDTTSSDTTSSDTDAGGTGLATQIVGRSTDADLGTVITGVTVELRAAGTCGTGIGAPLATTQTDSNGDYVFPTAAGDYCIDAEKTGYKPLSSNDMTLVAGTTIVVDLELASSANTTLFVQLCGQVTATDGSPIVGATVTLYGAVAGVSVAAATTNQSGTFCLPAVPASLAKVWQVQANKAGFDAQVKGSIVLVPSQVGFVGMQLTKSAETVCHSEDFEAGGWNASLATDGAVWQVRDGTQTLKNSAVPGCVALPPDETCTPKPGVAHDPCVICATAQSIACIPEPGALPRAYAGTHYAWFGNAKSGNYLGDLSKCVGANGGKTSVVITGDYTSKPIPVAKTATDFRLTLHHWFEVESQSPGALHDRMEVLASADGINFVSLGVLTPITLQAGSPAHGQTSAGFFTAPRWVQASLPLPAALQILLQNSGTVTLRLRFDSSDKEINGFRGWAVDALQILASGC